jgi:hypothetical protein
VALKKDEYPDREVIINWEKHDLPPPEPGKHWVKVLTEFTPSLARYTYVQEPHGSKLPTGPELFYKLRKRLEKQVYIGEAGLWCLGIPEDLVGKMTQEEAVDLERRLQLALRILKEGK